MMDKQPELFDLTNYPERWAFNAKREGGRLIIEAFGFYDPPGVGSTPYPGPDLKQCQLEYQDKSWVLKFTKNYESGKDCQLTNEQEKDLYREFAYYKAMFIKQREKRQLQGEYTRSKRRMH